MKTESTGRITWFANSRAMLEPRFRSLEQSLWACRAAESVHTKSTQSNGSKGPGHAPHSDFRDENGQTNPGVIVVPLDFILAPRKHGAWARLFLGPSTAERVTREAESLVIVLRAAHE